MSRSGNLQYEAEALGASLPPLLVDAERLASAVSLGVHGRRKAGMGESFWQFRRYRQEDSSTVIDWRQSAKSQHLFVREREWEAAQSVWFWCDTSAGMRFASGPVTKSERAKLIALALASLLVRGGERVALYGDAHAPASSRAALRRIGHTLLALAPDERALLEPTDDRGEPSRSVLRRAHATRSAGRSCSRAARSRAGRGRSAKCLAAR